MLTSPPLEKIHLSLAREKTRLHFHLKFHPSGYHPATVEFELSSKEAMTLLSALQSVQRRNGWTVPLPRPPGGGRPKLRIVKKDG